MKYRETESLSLSVCSQISFKSKRVDSGNESFDGVQRGACNWCILSDMTSERDEKHTVIITVRLYEPHTLLWRRLTLKMSASKSRCGVYFAFINFNGNALSETSPQGVIVDIFIKTISSPR